MHFSCLVSLPSIWEHAWDHNSSRGVIVVMANLHCLLLHLSHHGDTPLGVLFRVFPERFNRGRKEPHPECAGSTCGPGLYKKEEES